MGENETFQINPDPPHLPHRGDAGGFENTLLIEPGADNASRVKEVE